VKRTARSDLAFLKSVARQFCSTIQSKPKFFWGVQGLAPPKKKFRARQNFCERPPFQKTFLSPRKERSKIVKGPQGLLRKKKAQKFFFSQSGVRALLPRGASEASGPPPQPTDGAKGAGERKGRGTRRQDRTTTFLMEGREAPRPPRTTKKTIAIFFFLCYN
jgi:hypothetical protein